MKHSKVMRTIQQIVLLAVLTLMDAHPQPVRSEEGCSCEPGANSHDSYHIHVLFYPDGTEEFSNNTHSSKFARALRKSFIDHFNVPPCDERIAAFNLTSLCAFAVDATGAGGPVNAAPFVAPNFAFFVPVDRYADTVPWMMANRGDLDFMVHANQCGFACSLQTHVEWALWGGDKWQVRFQLPRP